MLSNTVESIFSPHTSECYKKANNINKILETVCRIDYFFIFVFNLSLFLIPFPLDLLGLSVFRA